jgi:hypothetical protein
LDESRLYSGNVMQITHNNHFVPQAYLKHWSKDGDNIWCYRILVSHAKVPYWELQPIRGVAYRRDLYTSLVGGQEVDEFERWLETEFETPAQEAIERAVHGDALTSVDWERLVRYWAAQDLRTPLSYIESVARWNDHLPKMLQRVLDQAVLRLEEAKRTGQKFSTKPVAEKLPFADSMKVTIDPHAKPETQQGEIRLEVTAGRRLWLDSQRHLLTNTANVLLSHSWSIAEAAPGAEWFTSDHPVARVNYYGRGNYDLKGGWGRKGGNLLMPLSSKHLLFTQIGEKRPSRFVLPERQTLEIRQFIAERAYRMIFAHREMPELERLRPRSVDPEMYQEEQDAWKNWHSEQSGAEKDLDEGK